MLAGEDPHAHVGAVRRVLDRVLDEVGEDLLDLHAVGVDRQVVARALDEDRTALVAARAARDDVRGDRDDVVPREVQRRAVVLDARYIEQVLDEPLEALAVLEDRLCCVVAHLRAQARAVIRER